MLNIITGLRDTEWLVYILEEFSRSNRVEFPIQVISPESSISSSNVIIYNENPLEGVCIPDRSYKQPDGKTRKISRDLFIIEGTEGEDNRFTCEYDLFWNAFVFLSRLEEYESEKKGGKIQSYSFKHPRKDKTTFDIPVVNHFFDELEKIIKTNFPELPFGRKQDPVIEYSHDVDYVQKTLQLRLKQTAFNVFKTFKSISSPIRFTEQAKKTVKFFFSNPSYWCFNYWEEIEKKAHVRSVFYVYAKTGKKDLKSWMLDHSYDVVKNIDLQNRLKCLIQEGFEVGLHGSFYSATDEERLVEEKNKLEESIGTKVQKTRQHWLKYKEMITPYIHNKLFKYDSTLGWNDRMGFRSGIAGRYRPYDHKNQRPFDYMITPQVIMDANIFDYGADLIKPLSVKATELLANLCQFKSAYVSVSWHQRVCNSDYRWHELYEQILVLEGHESK